ncbi:MAG TPA: sensory rhodopsin transducer [Rhizomicrobium sp.]|nr:sensory rhodopsin transducer [Rhizomicrobium sp.]
MSEHAGRKCWAIPEGYIPGDSVDPKDPTLVSHEVACLFNPSADDAHIEITIYFEDREPVGPYKIALGARRTKHLRFNDLKDPEPIPRDTSYASLIESSVPIIVQHTRLDSRHPNVALLSTIAYAVD